LPRCHNAGLALNGRMLVAGCSEGKILRYDLNDLIVPNELPTSSDPKADQLGRYAQFLSGCELRGGTTVAKLSPAEWMALAKRSREERLSQVGVEQKK